MAKEYVDFICKNDIFKGNVAKFNPIITVLVE